MTSAVPVPAEMPTGGTPLRVLVDARLAVRGLGLASFVDRLLVALAERPDVEVARWGGNGPWGMRGWMSTFARSGPFDLSPRLDPRTRGHDVVHFACNVGSVRPGPRSVLTVADLLHRRHLRPRDRLTGALAAACLRRAGRVVAMSRRTADEVGRAFPELLATIEVVPAGMRRLPHRDADPTHVLAFGGGHDPRKRVDLMIAAYRSYRSGGDALPLVVLSRAGLLDRQRAELEALGARLVPDASEDDVVELMTWAGAVLYPSAEEGFGLPLLEAAEVGTPVVMASGARLAREVIGPHCYPVAGTDPEGWALALRRAVERGPVPGALDLPGWDEVAARYVEIYRSIGP